MHVLNVNVGVHSRCHVHNMDMHVCLAYMVFLSMRGTYIHTHFEIVRVYLHTPKLIQA